MMAPAITDRLAMIISSVNLEILSFVFSQGVFLKPVSLSMSTLKYFFRLYAGDPFVFTSPRYLS